MYHVGTHKANQDLIDHDERFETHLNGLVCCTLFGELRWLKSMVHTERDS